MRSKRRHAKTNDIGVVSVLRTKIRIRIRIRISKFKMRTSSINGISILTSYLMQNGDVFGDTTIIPFEENMEIEGALKKMKLKKVGEDSIPIEI